MLLSALIYHVSFFNRCECFSSRVVGLSKTCKSTKPSKISALNHVWVLSQSMFVTSGCNAIIIIVLAGDW